LRAQPPIFPLRTTGCSCANSCPCPRELPDPGWREICSERRYRSIGNRPLIAETWKQRRPSKISVADSLKCFLLSVLHTDRVLVISSSVPANLRSNVNLECAVVRLLHSRYVVTVAPKSGKGIYGVSSVPGGGVLWDISFITVQQLLRVFPT